MLLSLSPLHAHARSLHHWHQLWWVGEWVDGGGGRLGGLRGWGWWKVGWVEGMGVVEGWVG